MGYIEKIKDMLCEELNVFSEKSKLSTSDLDMIHKLSDTIKNLDKIVMLEDNDYSETYSEHYPYYDNGSSYARRGTHYVKGHYSRDNDYSERYNDGYSRNEAKDKMMSKLGEMMNGANEKEREALKKAMREIERV